MKSMTGHIRDRLYSEEGKRIIKKCLDVVHYDHTPWARAVMYRECFRFIEDLGPSGLEVLEISAGKAWRQRFRFKSYTEANYPDFDICSMTLPQRFDLIIADQVFEHLLWPYRAGKNIHHMLKAGGHLLISTPFLIRVHSDPVDCSRWTELGLKHLLAECGFSMDEIKTGSWGNRACVKANFRRWPWRGWFKSLANEPAFPVTVWALAKRKGIDGSERMSITHER